ncbi:MAG: pyridoxamine 5'-phosphate oxidase [Verrucomicrobia bacterium]|nr:pyridoxamine 5'-phosphate oxidase [Verrucomicrobiota bacterium]
MAIADLRKEYTRAGLRRRELDPNPFQQFQKWFQQVLATQLTEPNAMTLATADKEGRPSARIVLLKGVDDRGFVFYTNYESRKGRDLAENPHAALVFYWTELERQVCVTGEVARVAREESEAYFKSRPMLNRVGAWVSKQSQVMSGREALEQGFKMMVETYRDREIPLPPNWGGFRLSPQTIEFWQGRPSRLHDRFRYSRQADNAWRIERLWP